MFYVTWVKWDITDGVSFGTEHFEEVANAVKYRSRMCNAETEDMKMVEVNAEDSYREYENADCTERFQIEVGKVRSK